MIRLIHEIRLRIAARTIRNAAKRDLQRIVDERARSFEIEQFRRAQSCGAPMTAHRAITGDSWK